MSHVDACREGIAGGGDIKGKALKLGMYLIDVKNSREAGMTRRKG